MSYLIPFDPPHIHCVAMFWTDKFSHPQIGKYICVVFHGKFKHVSLQPLKIALSLRSALLTSDEYSGNKPTFYFFQGEAGANWVVALCFGTSAFQG